MKVKPGTKFSNYHTRTRAGEHACTTNRQKRRMAELRRKAAQEVKQDTATEDMQVCCICGSVLGKVGSDEPTSVAGCTNCKGV